MTRSGLTADDERVLDELADQLIEIGPPWAATRVAEIKDALFTFVAQRVLHHGTNVTGRDTATGGRLRVLPADSDGPPATSVAKVWPEPGASPGGTRANQNDEGSEDARSVYEVELAEALWLVQEGAVWRLSRPWATRIDWQTGRTEHCTGFLGVRDVRVLQEGDRIWVRVA